MEVASYETLPSGRPSEPFNGNFSRNVDGFPLNEYGFPLNEYGFPLNEYGFPLNEYGFPLNEYAFSLNLNFNEHVKFYDQLWDSHGITMG